ncbi:hypothetical protein SAMN04515665_110141 [Blastococcus sp. DSM 46786]|uniref:hypothetical protein n=1 Tax=Blastococcus sp. DSM 46786 TaxID=1798227 RepID=UPI0008B1B12E|nr:hypothetical protein [Blastococcus sp. DSM 46786]SEL27382.1 hypothetical protein SAMN04515665_110141 [Blastococcus sp. DSM 46786]
MNDLTLLREAGPEAPPLSPAARSAARAALLAEIEGPAPRRRPRRRLVVRTGVAAVAVAAAWTAAVVIAAPEGPGTPATSVTLVDFEMPTFPLSLAPEPVGMRPAFTGDGESAGFAEYDSADGADRFTVGVHEDEPDWLEDGYASADVTDRREIVVDGVAADLVRGTRNVYCEDGLTVCAREGFAEILWERRHDQWVLLSGEGRYGRPPELVAVAESLVDRPQRATLAAELAPAGWSVQFYKMGRVLTLVNDSYEQQTITVHVPLPEDVPPLEQVRESLMGPVGPQLDVTVQGRPAALVRVDNGPRDRGWFLQAQFQDGTTFTLQVPDAFTQEQVLEFAEQVTYHP